MRSGCPDPTVLDALASGQLDGAVRAEVEAHLDGCAECAEVLATLLHLFAGSAIAGESALPASVPPSANMTTAAERPSSKPPSGKPASGKPASSKPPSSKPPSGKPASGKPPSSKPPSAAPEPVLLGRYRLGTRLGEGGMGIVFAAHDPELDRRVAVKLLHPDRQTAAQGAGSPAIDVQRARLMREAQAMAKLAHPNVVAVFDVGRVGDQLFIAMELIDGMTLTRWLADEPRSAAQIVDVFLQVGRGLAAAHAVGLVHRDFKPDNVLIGGDGRARVTDFGLARPLANEEHAKLVAALHLPLTATAPGAIVGTPAYMAPEQLRSEPADARSDQFAFCVALYQAMFGERPFGGDTLNELAANVLAGDMRAMPADAPRWLRALLTRGLMLEPAARFVSMDALLAELGRDHARSRRTALSLLGMAAGAGLIVGVLHVVTRLTAPAPSAAMAMASQSESTASGARERALTAPLVASGDGSAPRCDAMRLAVRDVWNAARKDALAERLAQHRAWVRELTPRIALRLDGWSDAWATQRRMLCIASGGADPTQLTDELVVRKLGCLDDGLYELEAMIGELGRAPERGMQRALEAIEALPSPNACADAAAVLRRAAPLPDPAHRADRRAITRALAIGKAQIALGLGMEARGDLDQLVEDARAAGDRPTQASALLWAVRAGAQEPDNRGAIALHYTEPAHRKLYDAFDAAVATETDDVALEVALEQFALNATRFNDDDQARMWLPVVTERAHRDGVDPLLRARFETAIGTWHLRARRLVDASAAFARALATTRQITGDQDPLVAAALVDLATAGLALGPSSEEPLDQLRRARIIAEGNYGAGYPATRRISLVLLDALVERRALAEAARLAPALSTSPWSPGEPDYTAELSALGRLRLAEDNQPGPVDLGGTRAAVYDQLGQKPPARYEEAERYFTRALEARKKLPGRLGGDAALSMLDLAALRAAQGRHADAVQLAHEALIWAGRHGDDKDPLRAAVAMALGDLQHQGGAHVRALGSYLDAIHTLERRFGAAHPSQAMARWALGKAYLAANNPARALGALDAAALPLEQSFGGAHPQIGRLTLDRAHAARAMGKLARARELYEAARHNLENSLGEAAPETQSAVAALKNLAP